jgi:hypothetical protein
VRNIARIKYGKFGQSVDNLVFNILAIAGQEEDETLFGGILDNLDYAFTKMFLQPAYLADWKLHSK